MKTSAMLWMGLVAALVPTDLWAGQPGGVSVQGTTGWFDVEGDDVTTVGFAAVESIAGAGALSEAYEGVGGFALPATSDPFVDLSDVAVDSDGKLLEQVCFGLGEVTVGVSQGNDTTEITDELWVCTSEAAADRYASDDGVGISLVDAGATMQIGDAVLPASIVLDASRSHESEMGIFALTVQADDEPFDDPGIVGAECEDGEQRCQDGKVQTCDRVGDETAWVDIDDCGFAGDVCVQEDGTASCVTPTCTPVTVSFEDLRLWEEYPYGTELFSDGFSFLVESYATTSGAVIGNGQATSIDVGTAGGFGKEVALGQATLQTSMPPTEQLSLAIADTGYDVELTINGETRSVADVADLDGDIIGGVGVVVVWSEAGLAQLQLQRDTRSILSLRVGGHEVFVDELEACTALPEPECVLGEQTCDGDLLRRCGYDPATASAREMVEDCGVGGGRCYEAVDGPRCIWPPSASTPGSYFAEPENYGLVKLHLKWQTLPATYDRSDDSLKLDWDEWSDTPGVVPNKADVIAAIDQATAWLNDPGRGANFMGEASTLLDPAGTIGSYTGDFDTADYFLPEAEAWDLYVQWVAHSIALDMAGELPWDLQTPYISLGTNLRTLFDSAELMFRNHAGLYGLGNVGHPAFDGTPWGSVLGATMVGTPRHTYAFLESEGLIGATPYDTALAITDWARDLHHYYGGSGATRWLAELHWGNRHWPTVEQVIEGTVRDVTFEFDHFTFGCMGTSSLIKHLLRAANVPARTIETCGHGGLWLPSEDAIMSHGDHPYNGDFAASTCSTDQLFTSGAEHASRHGAYGTNRGPTGNTGCDVETFYYEVRPPQLAVCE